MPRSQPEPELPSCTATLWHTGKPCQSPAVAGSPYCQVHLALIPPDEWVVGGYAGLLPDEAQSLFRSARFVDLSDEVALARIHICDLVQQHAPGSDFIAALSILAKLIKLRRDLDDGRFR